MKRSKFTEDQIAFALKHNELGTGVEEVCRKMAFSEADVLRVEEEVQRHRAVRAEAIAPARGGEPPAQADRRRPEPGRGDAAGGRRKKRLRPLHRRELVPKLMQRFGCSGRNALRIVRMSASTYRYKPSKRDEFALKLRITEITNTRLHYGYRRVHVLLRREGHRDNVTSTGGRAVVAAEAPAAQQGRQAGQPKQLAFAINEIWSKDFVADALFDGRKLRIQGAGSSDFWAVLKSGTGSPLVAFPRHRCTAANCWRAAYPALKFFSRTVLIPI